MSRTTITLHLPRTTPMEAVRALADSIGCRLRQRADGSLIAVPAAGNGNILKFPRHRGQYMPAPPVDPEPELPA